MEATPPRSRRPKTIGDMRRDGVDVLRRRGEVDKITGSFRFNPRRTELNCLRLSHPRISAPGLQDASRGRWLARFALRCILRIERALDHFFGQLTRQHQQNIAGGARLIRHEKTLLPA